MSDHLTRRALLNDAEATLRHVEGVLEEFTPLVGGPDAGAGTLPADAVVRVPLARAHLLCYQEALEALIEVRKRRHDLGSRGPERTPSRDVAPSHPEAGTGPTTGGVADDATAALREVEGRLLRIVERLEAALRAT